MCGISGYVAPDAGAVPPHAARRLRDAIAYRGRDEAGDWSDGRGAYLCHARLSIIDPEGGHQPMTDVSGRYTLVFSGEVYNYRELRRAYEGRGARFRTRSDTEVVLEGFRLDGPDVVRDLNGMFAFAVWDAEARQLFLARDRLGKKPLYWCALGDAFFFSSTLDAFAEIPGWTGRLSRAGIAQYVTIGSFPEAATVYEQAHALPWASCAHVDARDRRPRIERYWRMSFEHKSRGRLATLMEEYEELLADAVRIRLRSDVPLALTFSGGVDSGTIAWLCARRLEQPLSCYTVDYHTPEDPSEETINARRVADQFGLDWHYVHFDYHEDLLEDLPRAYRFYDQPCQQLPLVYADRLYRAIRPHATVVLSGNGSDELFTGYVGDERTRRRDLVFRAARPLRPLLARTSLPAPLRMPMPEAFVHAVSSSAPGFVGSDAEVSGAIEAAAQAMADEARRAGVRTKLDLDMFVALTCAAGDTNYRIPDVSGLSAQIEVRSPYLDHRLVEFAARLPHRFKIGSLLHGRANKYLPKKAYERVVPHDIAWSRKKGMGWNLRWDVSVARDPAYIEAFGASYDAIERSGLDAAPFREALRSYSADIRSGRQFSPHAGVMMTGFMFGAWLMRGSPVLAAP